MAGEIIRAVLFDFDGTLSDSEYLHHETWLESCGQAPQLNSPRACASLSIFHPPLGARGAPYFQVTSMAKKWSKTSRLGWLASFVSGLRI